MFWSWRRNKLKLFCWTFIIAKFWIINFGWEKNVFQSASLSETERLLDKRNMRWLHLQLLQDKNLWGGVGPGDWVAEAERSSSMCNHRWWIHKGRQKHRKKKNVFEWISTNVGFNIAQTVVWHCEDETGMFKIWVDIFGLKFDCGCWLKYLQWIFTKHLKALNWFKL